MMGIQRGASPTRLLEILPDLHCFFSSEYEMTSCDTALPDVR